MRNLNASTKLQWTILGNTDLMTHERHEHLDHFIPAYSNTKKIKRIHSHAHGHSHGHAHGHSHEEDSHWFKATLGLVWGIGLLILSIASFNLPFFVYAILTALTSLMTLYLGHRVY